MPIPIKINLFEGLIPLSGPIAKEGTILFQELRPIVEQHK
jgi:hypothetical protein